MTETANIQTAASDTGEGERMRPARTFRPPTDIVETEAGYSLVLEMPGVPPDRVDIELEGRELQIRGHAPPTEHGDYRLAYAEYNEGDYERAFTLSRRIDPDRITAEMRDGVLTLTLPRAEAEKSQRIEVRSA